ncbi:MAG: hypothetical protein Q9218_004726 [Villophora microphyllina]
MANTCIRYIPPQMGDPSRYTTRANRKGPLWLLIKDTTILISVLWLLPWVFLPLKSKYGETKKSTSWASIRDISIQCLLFLVETALLVLLVPALISLPAIFFIAAFLACVLLVHLIAWPTQGSRIVQSNMNADTLRESRNHQDERWVFINGICTGSSGLQQNVDRLSLLFGRSVLGIHNQSYGMIGDIIECILQRCLSYRTMDVRVACEIVKGFLMDREAKKVVLIGHSQGGIIVSMVLDQLFPELPNESMAKLVCLLSSLSRTQCPMALCLVRILTMSSPCQEIYTFGSAASHFHNPPFSPPIEAAPSPTAGILPAFLPPTIAIPPLSALTSTSPTDSAEPNSQSPTSSPSADTSQRDCIKYIEHYANELDMVPRWGVLYAVRALITNRYAGSVFVRVGATGHLFVEHYLDPIFTTPTGEALPPVPETNGGIGHGFIMQPGAPAVTRLEQPRTLDDDHDAQNLEEGRRYLGAVFNVDEQVVSKRQNATLRSLVKAKKDVAALNVARATATGNGVAATVANADPHPGSFVVITAGASGSVTDQQAKRYRGRNVRQISRLWMYLGGGSPPAEE